MSRPCRLRNAKHGADGAWAHAEITALRAQVAALTAALGKAREALWIVHHHNKLYHGGAHNTVTQTGEALAAIDGVLNQQKISISVTGEKGGE